MYSKGDEREKGGYETNYTLACINIVCLCGLISTRQFRTIPNTNNYKYIDRIYLMVDMNEGKIIFYTYKLA